MSSTMCGSARPESRGHEEPGGRTLLPAVRRVMQLGQGPAALKNWLRARGIDLAPRPVWTPADERTARVLAYQLKDVVGLNAVGGGGQPLAPRTYQPLNTVRAIELRVERR